MSKKYTIPSFSIRLLKWVCKKEYIEEIIGDLYEYHDELKSKTKWKRKILFWFHVFNFIKPWSVKSIEGTQNLNQYGMFKNFIKSALRSIKRQKAFSTINILGLSIGISVSLMLFLFIQHESSYDGFHEKGDRMFRVVSKYTTNNGKTAEASIGFGSVSPEIKKAFPEVEKATRIVNDNGVDIKREKINYQNQVLYYTEHDFFGIFTFNSLYGSNIEKTAFDNHGIILNSILATTIFGDQVPIGELIEIDGKEYTVLDVVEVPKKSHIQFDAIISLEGFEDLHDWSYFSGLDFHNYGLYAENTNHELVNEKISKLYNDQMNERFSDFISDSDNYVQPFKDIYLKSENISYNLGSGSIQTLYLIGGINILILLIAVINYINLTTAQYEKRIKEIGVRKVIGANRKSLIFQFLGESTVLAFIAFLIALGLTQLLIKPFGNLMQINSSITYWSDAAMLVKMVAAILILGLISGLYPSLFISKFSPTKILKRDFLGFKKGTKGNKVLVTLQFVIAILLTINLVFLNKQIEYVKNIDLGFSKDQILVVNNLTEKHKKAYKSIVKDLETSTGISQVTASQSALGRGSSGQTIHLNNESSKTAQTISEIRTMPNFINTYEISLLQGRDFSSELVTDKDAYIINQSGVNMLFDNDEDPIGQIVNVAGRVGPIIGIVEDFNFRNLKSKISPLVLSQSDPYRLSLSIKLRPNKISENLDHIEAALQQVDPDYEIGYYFLDDYFANMFEAEERNSSLISYSSLIAALISLVGLIALISHGLAKRIKEVAIRKVLGAQFKSLLWVLTKEYYLIIVIANIIAIPVSIYVMQGWLADFAYRVDISQNWIIFLVIALLSLAVAFSLILAQVVKKTRANPATVLGNE